MKRTIPSEQVFLFTFFILTILIGSGLLSIPGAWGGPERLRYIDAVFTSASAVCVTGLITVDTAQYTLLGKTFILLLIQVGGLGIISFTTIYLTSPNSKISFKRRKLIQNSYLVNVEHKPEKIIRNIVLVTLAFEALGTVSLYNVFTSSAADGRLFTALFHSVSAFCNAGFSLFTNNMEDYTTNVQLSVTIMLLIILGGLGFVVLQDIHQRIFKRNRPLTLHSKIVLSMTAFLILFGAAVYLYLERFHTFAGLSPGNRVLAALFQSVTTRTAGFNTVSQNAMSLPSKVFTLPLMFIGGSTGSIAGGIKVTTAALVILAILKGVDRNGEMLLGRRKVPYEAITHAHFFAAKAVGLLFISVMILAIVELPDEYGNKTFINLLFEVFSAFGTVGLSQGITGELTVPGKVIIICTMFAGRVGLVSLALPISPGYVQRSIDYPEGEVLIG